MKIKEVERRVGITSANIRYYEAEGLLNPERNPENNYRDYSEKDVACLQKIKTLRMLGVGLTDIKKVIDRQEELSDVLKRRILEIKAEEDHLEELERVCQDIVVRDLNFDTLDSQMIDEKKDIWQKRLADFLQKDITQEWVSPKKMNDILGGMFLYFFSVNAVIAFLLGDYIMDAKIPWTPVFILSVALMIGVAWTAKRWGQILIFQIITLVFTPICIAVLKGVMVHNLEKVSIYVGTVMAMTSVFVLLILLVYQVNKKFFEKIRYGIVASVVYTVLAASVSNRLIGNTWGIGIAVFVITIYLAINWSEKNEKDIERYNKYYAVSAAIRILDFPAQLMNGQYMGSENGYGRNK